MNRTDTIEEYVQKRILALCDQIGIPRCEAPIILWTEQEIKLFRNSIRKEDSNPKTMYGCWYPWLNAIYFNVEAIKNVVHLDETIIHELVHKRFPYISHGKQMLDRVTVIFFGKRFKEGKFIHRHVYYAKVLRKLENSRKLHAENENGIRNS